MYAGSIDSNEVFKKIVSIGFEFETHDFAKFSLHDNGFSLINTNSTIRTINYKMENNLSEKIDDSNYVFYIENDINVNKNNYDNKMIMRDNPLDNSSNIKSSANFTQSKATNGHIDEFTEYINDPVSNQNSEFLITNDIGNGEFHDMLDKCYKSNRSNNDIYIFKTDNNMFSLKFFEINDCQTISGVEFVSTYYKPKISSNIILEMFGDACYRILLHLKDLKKSKGKLYMRVNKKFNKVGNLDYRYIFHKPDTNLYYLHTNDDKYTMRSSSLMNSVIVPQMTFGCKASDLLDIMKQILNMTNKKYDVAKQHFRIIENEYEMILDVENITDQFIEDSYEKTGLKLDNIFKCYLFMILYKLYVYIQVYYFTDKSDYFKSYISFLSRHSNYSFYKLMIDWLMKRNKITKKKAVDHILTILKSSPKAISELYGSKKIRPYEILDKKNKNYGDPVVSIISYFQFFEDPSVDEGVGDDDQGWFDNDWLIYSGIEAFTTKMEIKNDILLTENRLFNIEIKTYIKNETNVKVRSRELKLTDLKNFIIDATKRNVIDNLSESDIANISSKNASKRINSSKRKGTRKSKNAN